MKKVFTIIVITSFVIYILILSNLLFFYSRGHRGVLSVSEHMMYASNLVPFKTIKTYVRELFEGRIVEIAVRNLAGNVIAFMPMGFYLPFFAKRLNKILIFTCSITALILAVESLQILTGRGSFDIDDLILNVIGALIGFVICTCSPVRKLFGLRTSLLPRIKP